MGKPVCYTGLGPNAKANVKPVPVKKLPEEQKVLKAKIIAARSALKLAEAQLKEARNECDCSFFNDEAGMSYDTRICHICGNWIYQL